MQQWTEGLQRQIIALAMRSDLLARTPGAFQSAMFGSTGGNPSFCTPRQRIASTILTYFDQYKRSPSPEILRELLRRIERLGDAERAELQREAELVLAT